MKPARTLRFGGVIWTLFVVGLVSAVFGGLVVLMGELIETKYPNDGKVWMVKAAGYGLLAIGLLVMSFRRSLTLDSRRGFYSRDWGFGIVFFRKTIPFSKFSHVLLTLGGEQEGRMSTRQHRVCLVLKTQKVGAIQQVDFGAGAVKALAGKVKARDGDIFGSIAKAALKSRKPYGYVMCGLCSYLDDLDGCRKAAIEIARSTRLPLHDRSDGVHTKIYGPADLALLEKQNEA